MLIIPLTRGSEDGSEVIPLICIIPGVLEVLQASRVNTRFKRPLIRVIK